MNFDVGAFLRANKIALIYATIICINHGIYVRWG